MSVLVCMRNEPAHPHIYIQALTVHLFVSVTAPWWLLFSPSWGGEGEAMRWGSLTRKCVVGRCLIPQRCFSLRLGGGVESATQREVNWRYCCQSTVRKRLHEDSQDARISLTDQTCPSPDEERGEREMGFKKQEGWQSCI